MRAFRARNCPTHLRISERTVVSRACFCTGGRLNKRPVRSPTVRRNERSREQGDSRPSSSEKWPMPFLEQIVGGVPCFAGRSVRDLVAILDDVQNIDPSKAKEHAKRICTGMARPIQTGNLSIIDSSQNTISERIICSHSGSISADAIMPNITP